MAYSQIRITIKKPSKELEAFMKDLGVKKNERLEALRNSNDMEQEIRVSEKKL